MEERRKGSMELQKEGKLGSEELKKSREIRSKERNEEAMEEK